MRGGVGMGRRLTRNGTGRFRLEALDFPALSAIHRHVCSLAFHRPVQLRLHSVRRVRPEVASAQCQRRLLQQQHRRVQGRVDLPVRVHARVRMCVCVCVRVRERPGRLRSFAAASRALARGRARARNDHAAALCLHGQHTQALCERSPLPLPRGPCFGKNGCRDLPVCMRRSAPAPGPRSPRRKGAAFCAADRAFAGSAARTAWNGRHVEQR